MPAPSLARAAAAPVVEAARRGDLARRLLGVRMRVRVSVKVRVRVRARVRVRVGMRPPMAGLLLGELHRLQVVLELGRYRRDIGEI